MSTFETKGKGWVSLLVPQEKTQNEGWVTLYSDDKLRPENGSTEKWVSLLSHAKGSGTGPAFPTSLGQTLLRGKAKSGSRRDREEEPAASWDPPDGKYRLSGNLVEKIGQLPKLAFAGEGQRDKTYFLENRDHLTIDDGCLG